MTLGKGLESLIPPQNNKAAQTSGNENAPIARDKKIFASDAIFLMIALRLPSILRRSSSVRSSQLTEYSKTPLHFLGRQKIGGRLDALLQNGIMGKESTFNFLLIACNRQT